MIDKLDGKQDGPACVCCMQLCLDRAGNHKNLTGDGSTKCIGLFTNAILSGIATGNRTCLFWLNLQEGVITCIWNVFQNLASVSRLRATLLRCHRKTKQ